MQLRLKMKTDNKTNIPSPPKKNRTKHHAKGKNEQLNKPGGRLIAKKS